MITVMHLADVINRGDFIDTVVRGADRARFRMLACTFTAHSNIAPPEYERAGIPQFILQTTRRWQYPRAAVRLARLLRKERVDVLHAHHYDGAVLGMLATRLVPKTKLMVGRHYSEDIYLHTRGIKQRALLAIEQMFNRLAARIVVPSTMIRTLLVDRQLVDTRRVATIPYAFELSRYSCQPTEASTTMRRELGPQGQGLIGNFGRHGAGKGIEYLLEAFADLRRLHTHVRLVLVGDGPSHADLKRQAQRLGLLGAAGQEDPVVFTGWRSDRLDLMRAMDIIVHPSLAEAFSSVMVESLLMAKPLVITDVSGAEDLITDGRDGLIVPKRDPQALMRALQRLLEDPALGCRLGQAGRDRAVHCLDATVILPRYESLYESVAA